MMRLFSLLLLVSLLTLVSDANAQQPRAQNYTPVRQSDGTDFVHVPPVTGEWWTTAFINIGATLTQIKGAPAAGKVHYITDIFIQTTTTTSGTYALQSGTGSNCGTGTLAIFPITGTADRFNAPPNTTAGQWISFKTPIILPATHALCVIGVVTNTVSGQVNGYDAP